MAGDRDHIQLTEHALSCAGWKNPEQVVACCLYPDEYFGPKQPEIKPYMFFWNDIQFHYPPDGNWIESYRYWDYAPERGFFHACRFQNRNFQMADAGFRYYVNKCLEEPEKIGAYLGCLLHFLEDATFGVHVLEGPGGADLFTLDRFAGKAVVAWLCQIKARPEFRSISYTPAVLGADVEECVSMLYARYVKQNDISRKALFQLAMNFIANQQLADPEPLIETIYRSSLSLIADAVCSIQALLNGKAAASVPAKRDLIEFAPFQVPVGGSGKFNFMSAEEQGNDIVYGSHYETTLLYSLPQKTYKEFDCILSGSSQTDTEIEVINHNQKTAGYHLRGEEKIPCHIVSPGGIFGIRSFTRTAGGEIRIGNGSFAR